VRCAAFAHAANEHFYLLYDIAARQFDRGHDDLFEAYGIAAGVANKVYMIIAVLSAGTVIFA